VIETPASAAPEPQIGQLREKYLDLLLAPDARGARDLARTALESGVSASALYLQVITPAMHEIGRLWESAQITVAQEHLSTQISQMVIATLGGQIAGGEPIGAGRAAIVASSPGERHALGGAMVADFLESQGWDVLALGADIPVHELIDLTQDREAHVVALSTALPGNLLSVTRTCQLLRRLPNPPLIVVGGRAYRGDESRATAVGADAFADDPETLLDLLQSKFGAD
jgi:MerR family transcriptional regulator, light-induced transcriptional regulator